MLFNSIEFAVFLTVVFLIYWFTANRSLNLQNRSILLASYFFYAFWDWRFLVLLIAISIFNFLIAIEIDKNGTKRKRKILLLSGLIVDTGILLVFKYFNFFVDSFINLVSLLGYSLPKNSTSIIVPLGISFYSLLCISYIVDVYRKDIVAEKNLENILLSLCFFPIITMGPIQRPATLLPQIGKPREFDYDLATDGLRQILWGLVAKMVIADNISPYVDSIFLNYNSFNSSTLLLGSFMYMIQIYADFSGYSNIAIGTAKLLGFRLMQNFACPYFSRDIAGFWKKWHISLTSWFRNYIFLPLSMYVTEKISGAALIIKSDLFAYIVASAIVWMLTGIWHGSGMTFLLWGVINGAFLIIYHAQRKPRKKLLSKLGTNNDNKVIAGLEAVITLTVILIAWVIFRADNITMAIGYLHKLFSPSIFHFSIRDIKFLSQGAKIAYDMMFVLIFLAFEWFQRDKQHALQFDKRISSPLRWSIYYCLIFMIIYFRQGQNDFIYLRF